MSHVDDGTLHELVDNELAAAERIAVEAHLASCGDCAKRFAEATSLARQTLSLLSALDDVRGAVQVIPMPAVSSAVRVTSLPAPRSAAARATRPPMWTLRRLAVAASVMLVAGVSYQVGKRGDVPATALETAVAVKMPRPSASLRTVPSVVDAPSSQSYVATPAPAGRLVPRGGPRADAESSPREPAAAERQTVPATALRIPSPVPTSQAAAAPAASVPDGAQQRQQQQQPQRVQMAEQSQSDRAAPSSPARRGDDRDGQSRSRASGEMSGAQPAPVQQQRAPSARTQEAGASVADLAAAPAGNVSPAKKPGTLAGYTTALESAEASVTRLRYTSSAGTPLTLLIVPSVGEAKRTRAAADVSEFVVSTANGVSAVRWQTRGVRYELSGALAPDSLVKLAAQLK